MPNNNNNKKKKCSWCGGPIDFSKCDTERKMFRAKQLSLCVECQDKTFGG